MLWRMEAARWKHGSPTGGLVGSGAMPESMAAEDAELSRLDRMRSHGQASQSLYDVDRLLRVRHFESVTLNTLRQAVCIWAKPSLSRECNRNP